MRIKQEHGLGDAVALTAILRHIQEPVELIVKPGREALYDVPCVPDDPRRPPTHALIEWPRPTASNRDCPSTWVERCLRETFNIKPVAELCRYQVRVRDDRRRRIKRPDGKLALCHFRGQSFKDRKDVDDYTAADIATVLEQAGYNVLIWDANDPTTLPEHGIGQRVPASDLEWDGILDAGMLAALIDSVDLFVGVDSGPLHLASAIGKRAIGLWPRQSPLHCICHDNTTTHLILKAAPEYERFLIYRPIEDGLEFFKAHYQHVYCDNFAAALRGIF